MEERELGHELAHCLVNAGVVCVGHLCRTQVNAAGIKSHAWMSFQEARSAHCRLARYDGQDRQEAEAAWGTITQVLEDANVCPVTAEPAYSTMINEPTTAGGVGLRAEPRLLSGA